MPARSSTGRPVKIAPSLPQTSGRPGARPYYSAPQYALDSEEVRCACEGEADEYVNKNWFECTGCQAQQHVDCATPNTGILESVSVLLCNECKVAELHAHFASQREQFEQLAAMLREKRKEAYNLCSKVLWKHYCNLPKGHLPDRILEITKTEAKDGAMVPVLPAPQSWVEEVQNRIAKMVGDAGEAVIERILGVIGSGDLITDASHLRYWRELAMWLLHHGPYRRNTAELGLLGEVLGFEERGTFWQEGWMGIEMAISTDNSPGTLVAAEDVPSTVAEDVQPTIEEQ